MKHIPWITLSFIVIVLCLVFLWNAAFAHDKRHPITPQQKSWFDTLRSDKGPCCADADGNVLTDNDWDSKDGHYRVFIDGQWMDVPDSAVLTQPNMYGPTMVWGYPVYNGESGKMRYEIRCFLPGMMT